LKSSSIPASVLAALAQLGLLLAAFNLGGIPFLSLKPDPVSGSKTYEPFAVEVTLMMQTGQEGFAARRLTPEAWSQLGRPKARSRAYAKALTEAPVLPPTDWAWVLSEQLKDGKSRLARELEVPANVSSITLSVKSLTPGNGLSWLLEPTE